MNFLKEMQNLPNFASLKQLVLFLHIPFIAYKVYIAYSQWTYMFVSFALSVIL